MIVYLPDDIPVIDLVHLAAKNGYDIKFTTDAEICNFFKETKNNKNELKDKNLPAWPRSRENACEVHAQ